MISFSGVSKSYPGGFEALRGVTFSIAAGEFVCLSGHSGAGKSTLIKLVAALELPTRGTVLVNGQNTAALRPRSAPYYRRNFGVVFQDHKLLFDRNVLENVLLPLRIAGVEAKGAAKRARAALDKVGLLTKEKAFPVTLSGGEQQRLAIARAVVHRPPVLLADEPTGSLDAAYSDAILDIFRAFHQVGMTIIMATHDESIPRGGPVRVLRLRQGTLMS